MWCLNDPRSLGIDDNDDGDDDDMEKTQIRHQKNEFGGGEVTSFIRTQNGQDTANTATFSKATNARRLRVAFGPHRRLFLARETQIWYQNKNGVG